MANERRSHIRFILAVWLFVLSGISFLDRTNISIAGLQISHEYGLGNQRLGWIFSAFLIGYAGFQLPAVGIVWWLVARDTPDEHPLVSAAELAIIRSGLTPSLASSNFAVSPSSGEPPSAFDLPPEAATRPPIPWGALWRRGDLFALMASYFTFGYVAWIFFSWFFLYMAQVRRSRLPHLWLTGG